jgi:hypothetical protein
MEYLQLSGYVPCRLHIGQKIEKDADQIISRHPGTADTSTVFDLKTLAVLGEVKTGGIPTLLVVGK